MQDITDCETWNVLVSPTYLSQMSVTSYIIRVIFSANTTQNTSQVAISSSDQLAPIRDITDWTRKVFQSQSLSYHRIKKW